MCLAAAAIPAASLAISAVSTVASIGMGVMQAQQQAAQAQAQLNMQAQQAQRQQQMQHQSMVMQQEQQYQNLELQQRQQQQNYNLSVANSNAQMLNQYNQQIEQVKNERASIASRHAAEKLTYQRTLESAQEQSRLNNEAANRVYMGEQAKMNEARKKAAFEQQAILAKSIGAKGSVLAAGRTGQSVGLLANDVERQAGFAIAQEAAMAEARNEQSSVAMESAFIQNQSDNQKAANNVSWNPSDPYMPGLPDTPAFINGEDFSIQYQ